MPQHTIQRLTEHVLRHRDERDWAQFHTPKELAISLCVESAELLSLMQWKSPEQVQQVIRDKRQEVQDELADVLHSVLLLASDLDIELGEALVVKLKKDAEKYPIAKAKG